MNKIVFYLSFFFICFSYVRADLVPELQWVTPGSGSPRYIGTNRSMVLTSRGMVYNGTFWYPSVWDANTGKLIRTITDTTGKPYFVWPCGAESDYGVVTLYTKGSRALFMNLRTGEIASVLFEIPFTGSTVNIVFGADLKTLLVVFNDKLELWDTEKGVLLRTVKSNDTYWGVAANQQGTLAFLLTTSSDPRSNKWSLWDLSTLTLIKKFEYKDGVRCFFSFSKEGYKFFNIYNTGIIEVHDSYTGELLSVINAYDPLTINTTASFIVSASSEKIAMTIFTKTDTTVKIWDSNTGSLISSIPFKNKKSFSILRFSEDEESIIVTEKRGNSDSAKTAIYSINCHSLVESPMYTGVNINYVGYVLNAEDYVLYKDNGIVFIDGTSGKEKLTLLSETVAYDKGSVIATGKNTIALRNSLGKVMLIDAKTGMAFTSLHNKKSLVTELSYNSNANVLLSRNEDKTANLWNAQNGELLFSVDGYEKGVLKTWWNKNDEQIITHDADTAIRVWSANNGELLSVLQRDPKNKKPINDVLSSSDGNIILTRHKDDIDVWNANTGSYLYTIQPEGKLVSVLSPIDNNTVITITNVGNNPSLLTLTNIETGQIIKKSSFDIQYTNAILNKKRNRILLEDNKGYSYLLSFPALEKVAMFKGTVSDKTVNFNKEGNLVTKVSRDNYIFTIYSSESGKVLHSSEYDKLYSLVSMDNNNEIITINTDGHLAMWRVSEQETTAIEYEEENTEEQSNSAAITVYPNPVVDVIYVSTKNINTTDQHYTIINTRAERIQSGIIPKDTDTYQITTSQWESGTYMLILGTDNAQCKKFTILR